MTPDTVRVTWTCEFCGERQSEDVARASYLHRNFRYLVRFCRQCGHTMHRT